VANLGVVGTQVGIAAASASALVSTFIKPYRAITEHPINPDGTAAPDRVIQADAVVEESHHDELMMTDHPVEQGATITDHAYKMPAELTLTYGWSGSHVSAIGNSDYLRDLYRRLFQLQIDRTLFSVDTGKRTYQDMLMKSLSLTNDERTENVIVVKMVCRQILLAKTTTASVANNNVQRNALVTGTDIKRGAQSATPTSIPAGLILQ
jgi:hypothetical protein